ncbi:MULTISPECIES: MFS transporter [Sphingomonadaceae]|uniref:MFS transporter n=1 Tax=Sphingomonadales TaxID=204457 RepID=UPI00073126F7|nr:MULTISPECIES: MFS transporter [Sphingomonadaceae]KTE24800.1 MFS transporter [Sphingopyxis sp. H057]KTE50825.1 MFS transporter [Sphingopyxis sp. H073]KTE51810.1 MFS transporter [Sphingopyxis sp. H071]KTE58394.1 MFS transporter [Sphingopyxis sp. H107]KTE64376.1 MFS transporter [Sphingopyxis sp. H100]
MLAVLANRTYRHLFLAQIIALVGTGLATVALGLLAFEIAGADAGAVLGTAMAIKMVAYIGVAPVVGAYANRLPRKAFLVAMDVVRGLVALTLPFVDQVWQIYLLIFILQSASAGFTPTFQATIPDVLPDEKDYTRALSLSRLAYDMESLASPVLAAALLGIMNFHWLFSGTAIGFACSALLVLSVVLPRTSGTALNGGIYDKTTRGTRQYLKTPRLRGLLAVTLAAAAASAMVIVNTPVLVRGALGLGQSEVAITLAAFGGGSMIAALLLPRLLDRIADRSIMIAAALSMTIVLAILAIAWSFSDETSHWPIILGGWFALGLSYAASITPGGRLLRRSSGADDRPALFAAQFALSHVCWLLAYPLAGQVGARAGMGAALGASAVLALVGALIAIAIWPREDPDIVAHRHDDLPASHPHIADDHAQGQANHVYVIDELHTNWPRR